MGNSFSTAFSITLRKLLQHEKNIFELFILAFAGFIIGTGKRKHR
jgi:hypothetical protein